MRKWSPTTKTCLDSSHLVAWQISLLLPAQHLAKINIKSWEVSSSMNIFPNMNSTQWEEFLIIAKASKPMGREESLWEMVNLACKTCNLLCFCPSQSRSQTLWDLNLDIYKCQIPCKHIRLTAMDPNSLVMLYIQLLFKVIGPCPEARQSAQEVIPLEETHSLSLEFREYSAPNSSIR